MGAPSDLLPAGLKVLKGPDGHRRTRSSLSVVLYVNRSLTDPSDVSFKVPPELPF